jgi:hypothetical protein
LRRGRGCDQSRVDGAALGRVVGEGESGEERLFGGFDFVQGFFVVGEFANELEDEGDV